MCVHAVTDRNCSRTFTVWTSVAFNSSKHFIRNQCTRYHSDFRAKREAPLIISCLIGRGCVDVSHLFIYVCSSSSTAWHECVCVFGRESLIDKRIESAVSQMQSVIELGRVIRDRKTLPVKVRDHPYDVAVNLNLHQLYWLVWWSADNECVGIHFSIHWRRWWWSIRTQKLSEISSPCRSTSWR